MVDRRTSTDEIRRMLHEGKQHLQEGNIFSGIVALRDALDIFIHVTNIAQSEKSQLTKDINAFQRTISITQQFNDLYGKVYFRENDFATSYDFLCQLIKIKEDEISDVLVQEESSHLLNLDYLSREDQQTAKRMVSLVERGELSTLRELVAAHDGLGSLILSFYNETGISHRESGHHDKAIIGYKKALSVSQNDENLYYNLARAYIEIGQKKNAEASIRQALQINPQFEEGLKLEKYIQQWSR
ncbi:MAG: tetratricopeptide repeat protein [Deltaproteobacteria bacterium]